MASVLNWFEIPTIDFDRAVTFYSTILEGDFHKMPMNDEMLAFFPMEGEGVGGALVSSPRSEPSDKGTMVYLNSGDDLAPILARVEPAGGKVVVPKTQVTEDIGYVAVFQDSEGNLVGLHSPK